MDMFAALESILGGRLNIAILRLLTALPEGKSGNEIARALGVGHSSAHQALGRLVQAGVVTRRDIGRTGVYALNQQLGIVKSVLIPLFEHEAALREAIFKQIAHGAERLHPKPLATIVFGSLAQGTREFRDIDILCIAKDKADKEAIRDASLDVWHGLSTRYNAPVSPIVITASELTSASKFSSIARAAREHGILVQGTMPRELTVARSHRPA